MTIWIWGAFLGLECRLSRALSRLEGDQRGQALVEYSTITFAILGAAAALGFGAKWQEFGNQSLVQALYESLQTYVNSVNFSLSLAAT